MPHATQGLQHFFDVACRRAREARVLLDYPQQQKQKDGAVTFALLAAECALKAALLKGLQVNTVSELSDHPAAARLFGGKKGHNLAAIWGEIPAAVKAQAGNDETGAVSQLKRCGSLRLSVRREKTDQATRRTLRSSLRATRPLDAASKLNT